MLTTSNDPLGTQPFQFAAGRIASVVSLTVILLLFSALLLNQSWRVQAGALNISSGQPTAAIRYVAVEGTDAGNDCATSTTPCATVQHAVDVAAPDDEIRVAAGTYAGVQVRESITQVVYISQSVTIRGGFTTTNWATSDPETYATILDAQGQGRVIVIPGGRVVLEGLRMTGGDTRSFVDLTWGITGRNGGGVYIDAYSQVTVSNSQIYSNIATTYGGGLYAYSSIITVAQNRIFSNSLGAAYSIGGGIYAELGISVVDHNIVSGNSAFHGGGVYLGFGSWGGRLSENQIYNNQALQYGGGLLLISTQTPDVLISSNVFSQNVAGANGGGMWLGTGISVVTGNLVISNTATDSGGGVYVLAGADTLRNNRFISNTTAGFGVGGGVYLNASPVTLIENYFQNNIAGIGGGLHAYPGSDGFTATANIWLNNSAAYGGGLSFYGIQGPVVIERNSLLQNKASSNGGAIFGVESGPIILDRNIISGNFGSFKAGISLGTVTDTWLTNNAFLNNMGYALTVDSGFVTVAHNTLVSNLGGILLENYTSAPKLTLINTILAKQAVALDAAAGTTSTLDGVLWFGNSTNTTGSGLITVGQQITANPQLAADGYHLLTGSPAIDAGVPSGIGDDLDGEPRPSGPAVDIGADEWQYPTTVDLSVTHQVAPVIAYSGDNITYTIAYHNAGSTATGVMIAAEIPTGLLNLTVVSSGGVVTAVSQMPYTWQVADLPSGAGGLITITATVLQGLSPQVLTSTGSITASQVDSDLSNNSASAVLTIANHVPLANAGQNQTAFVNEPILLDGSASTDSDGHLPLAYEWQQIGGIPIVLSSNVVSRPLFIAPTVPSILTFALNVADSAGLRSATAATTVVTVTDQPVSNLVALSDSPTTLGQPTYFTATAAGSNLVYTWDFGDGVMASANPISHTYLAQGAYTAIVTVTNEANFLSQTMPVSITNLAPVAVAGADQTVLVNSQVDLDGSGSYDQDGHWPLVYHWLQTDGPVVVLSSESVSRPTFSAPASPTWLTFTLRVTDAFGLASGAESVGIKIVDQSIGGLQIIDNSPVKVGGTAVLTAVLATGSNVIYQWNFGDGVISDQTTFLTTTHVYTRYGAFTAIVTATNQTSVNMVDTVIVIQPYSIYVPILQKDFD